MSPSRARRIARFFARMFPPWVYIPSSLASFCATYLSLQAFSLQGFAGRAPLRLGWRALAGAATVLLFTLLLRLYDELKDVDTDLRLGRAGDPGFADRPLVTGAIRVDDLVALRWGTSTALFAINLPLGFPWPLLAFLGVYVLTWLSFKWFFWPPIARNLLLAFATHNPLTLAVGGYVIAVYCRDFGAQQLTAATFPLLGAAWFPVAAWETSRKIRPPAAETDYQTYSRMLSWQIAPLLPAIFLALSAASHLLVARAAGLGLVYPAAAAGSAALGMAACLRFRLSPSARTAQLRPYAELHALVGTVGLAWALWLRWGLAWR